MRYFGAILIIILAGCSTGPVDGPNAPVVLVRQADFYTGSEQECWSVVGMRASTQTQFAERIPDDVGSASSPVLFTFVVHIETDDFYLDPAAYARDAGRLMMVAEILAKHGGRMTIQTQPPFLYTSNDQGDQLFHRLASMGNEIALHLHENYQFGPESENLGVGIYARRLSELMDEIESASGQPVLTWSGGNTYDYLWEAAAGAGLRFNTNYKDPDSQASDPGFAVVNPWRPSGAASMSERQTHDPDGSIIYIPSGVFPTHCTMIESIPRPYGYEGFDYVTIALRASLASASSDHINTFYITFHPDDFLEEEDDMAEYAVWDAWLSQVIDPLVADGRVQWATVAEMGEAFVDWEGEK